MLFRVRSEEPAEKSLAFLLAQVRTMIYGVAPQPSAQARVRSDLMSAQSPRSAAAIRMVRGVSTGSEDGKHLNDPPCLTAVGLSATVLLVDLLAPAGRAPHLQ